MDTRHFHQRLYEATRLLFPQEGLIVCAVSGGADSMALLHGLHRVRHHRRCAWKLHVAHLDHHLPHNSADMMRFVVETSARLEIPCTTGDVDVPALSRETRESIEEAGRKARYDFLARVARETGADCVAVAHQADDQAETVLHRIVRGTGLRGLAGMRQSRRLEPGSEVRLVRPLLAFTRDQCNAYLERRNLTFMHDATNYDVDAARRNRIRHQVMPLLQDHLNPNVVGALNRLASQAHAVLGALDTLAGDLLARARLPGDKAGDVTGIRLDVRPLGGAPFAIVSHAMLLACQEAGVPAKSLHAERLNAVAAAAIIPGLECLIELPAGFIARRRGRVMFIGHRSRPAAPPANPLPEESA